MAITADHRRSLLVAAATLAIALLLLCRPAQAVRIQLRARTELTLQATQEATGLQVRGRLVDSRGVAVDGAHVQLQAVTGPSGALPLAAQTNAQGWFHALLPRDLLDANAELVHLEGHFAGDPRLGEATAEQTLDLKKLECALELQVPAGPLLTDGPALELQVLARSGELPIAAAQVQVLVDGRQVVVVQTAGDGSGAASIPPAQFGGGGPHTIEARLAPSEQFNDASAVAHIDVRVGLSVELHVTPGVAGQPCAAGDWCLEGSVQHLTANGPQGAVDATVHLHADKHLLGSLVTHADGRFAGVLRGPFVASLFAPGPVGLVARAQSPAPFTELGWSPIAVLDVPPPPELSVWFYGVPVLLLVAATLLQRWRARRREKSLLVRSEATLAGLPSEAVRRVGEAALPSCTLRGHVLHGETGRPAPARLELTQQDLGAAAPIWAMQSRDGHFDSGELPVGRYILWLHCAEHEPLRLQVDLPHDGTFDGCELLPSSCRAIVRGSFGAAVRRWTGRGVDWGTETPRDVEPRWTGAVRRGHGDVREAVRRVDRALYGARTDSPLALTTRQAIDRVDEVQR